jgi:hypothetical protein
LRGIDTAVAVQCPPKAPKNAASLGGLRRHRERHEEVGLHAVRLEVGLLECSLATLAQGVGVSGADNLAFRLDEITKLVVALRSVLSDLADVGPKYRIGYRRARRAFGPTLLRQ